MSIVSIFSTSYRFHHVRHQTQIRALLVRCCSRSSVSKRRRLLHVCFVVQFSCPRLLRQNAAPKFHAASVSQLFAPTPANKFLNFSRTGPCMPADQIALSQHLQSSSRFVLTGSRRQCSSTPASFPSVVCCEVVAHKKESSRSVSKR